MRQKLGVSFTVSGSVGLLLAFFLPVTRHGRNPTAAVNVVSSIVALVQGESIMVAEDLASILLLSMPSLTGLVFLASTLFRSPRSRTIQLRINRGLLATWLIGFAILATLSARLHPAARILVPVSIGILVLGAIVLPGWRPGASTYAALCRYQVVGGLLSALLYGFIAYMIGWDDSSYGVAIWIASASLLLLGGILRRPAVEWSREENVMSRVTVRITQQDGCVTEITMPARDYERLHERWLDLTLGDGTGSIPLPTPDGDLVDVPASEIRSLEPIA